jgi:hypothetical protein
MTLDLEDGRIPYIKLKKEEVTIWKQESGTNKIQLSN